MMSFRKTFLNAILTQWRIYIDKFRTRCKAPFSSFSCSFQENITKQECIPVGCIPPAAVAITGEGVSPLDQAPPRPPGPGTLPNPLNKAPQLAADPPGPGTPLVVIE